MKTMKRSPLTDSTARMFDMFDHQFIVIFMAMFKAWYKERYRIHAGLKTA